MNIGTFTGIIKNLDLRHLDSGKQVCNVWLEVSPGEPHSPYMLPMAAWDDLALVVAQMEIGEKVTVEAYVEVEAMERNGSKHKQLLATMTRLEPLNTLSLVGRIGGEPEIKTVDGKDGATTKLAKLTLAVNQRSHAEPSWFNLECWGRTAEIVEQYVHKGSQIGISGELRIDTWKNRTSGEDRSRPVIRVFRLDLLGAKQQNDSLETEAASPSVTPAGEPETPSPAKPAKRKSKAA